MQSIVKVHIWSRDVHLEALVFVLVTDEGAGCSKDVKKPLSVAHDPSLLLTYIHGQKALQCSSDIFLTKEVVCSFN